METELEKPELLEELKLMGIKNPEVLDAIEQTPRELFVPETERSLAYKNIPLEIGLGQTISQPYTVAFMLELLELKKGNRVLEIGAGSGYNAAVMSHLIGKNGRITSLELESSLSELARLNLKKALIQNVTIINKDGYGGFKAKAPYDRIILTAAPQEIPPALLKQLKDKGIMVLPLENTRGDQEMTKVIKTKPLRITKHGFFIFVPLRRSR